MSLAINHFYKFGEFIVDGDQKVLLRNDSPLPLAPKVFDTLLILVDSGGRIVEKEQLMSRLWPDSFVEESNLTFNIQQLRKALGDSARQPRFIETVPRRGYRFIAEVKQGFDNIAATTEITKSAAAAIPRASRRTYLFVAAAAVLAISSAVIAFRFAQNRRASSLSAPILSAPFKSEKFANPGSVNAVITPDGKYVAYTSETGGKESIWLRQLETSENIQIVPPTVGQYYGLAISHDGNSLYFVRRNESDSVDSVIYRVMTFGGIPVKVTERTQGWISISPDDRQISFVRCNYQDEDFCSLFVVDATGKNERKILSRPRPFRIADNQFSPDGKSIAFAAGQSFNGGSDFRLMMVDLTTGLEKQISSKTFFEIKSLQWLPGGDGLLLTAQELLDGRLKIWQVTTATGEVKALTSDATNYGSISLNKAADKMVATYITNSFRLYLAPGGDFNNAKNLAAARTFAFGHGGTIFYADDGDIWRMNYDGGEQRQLTNTPFKETSPCVSPDGRYLFFASARSGSNQVWRMNADGTNQIQLTNGEGGYPRFVAPDQRWVYFESALDQKLWRVPTEGGEEIQVSDERVARTAFSPDGKLAAYFSRSKDHDSRRNIAVMSLETGKVLQTFALAGDKSIPNLIAWATDSQSFDYILAGSSNSLWRQPLNDHSARLIADLGREDINDYAISPDGNYVGFIRGQWILGAVLIEGLK